MTDVAPPPPAAPTPIQAGLGGLCPRCGARTLFAGWIGFAACCPACGLDFAAFNVGDGPAAFLTLIIGTVVTGLAIWLQLAVGPPWWVHVLLWPTVTLGMILASLRASKGVLLALEYRNHAGEGRIVRES